MNIGIVTAWFERGAAYVSRAYMETISQEHNVFIYARGGEEYAIGDPRWDLPNVTWGKKLNNIYQNKYIVWPDFHKWLKKNKIDLIIFNEQQSWDILLRLRKLKYLTGAYVDYYTYETKPFFTLYDFLLCNTKRHFETFKDHKQCFYIPWGTDVSICKPQITDKKSNEVTFFHSSGMGGINLRKGTDILIRAFLKIKGSAKLIIHSQVGIEKYKELAEILPKHPEIEFIEGNYPLPGLYSKGDVYVYPSKLEGIGLSVPEALACGLPVITTDSPPMNEFVENGKTGYLVEIEKFKIREDDYYWPESYCSETSLINAMQKFVDNPYLSRVQGINARNKAEKDLNWAINSKKLNRILTEVKKTQSYNHHDIQTIKKYEFARNIFLLKAKEKINKREYSEAFVSFMEVVTYHPDSIFKLDFWTILFEFIFRNVLSINEIKISIVKKLLKVKWFPTKFQNYVYMLLLSKELKHRNLFNEEWYLHKYQDVMRSGIDAFLHYLVFGAKEGRLPSKLFDGNRYLEENPDVQRSGINPLVHYFLFGKLELRNISMVNNNAKDLNDSVISKMETKLLERPTTKKFHDQPTDILVIVEDNLSNFKLFIRTLIPTLRQTDKILLLVNESFGVVLNYCEYLLRIFPKRVKVIKTSKDWGEIKALDFGLSMCNTDYVAILDCNSCVTDNWLFKLESIFCLDQSIGVVGPISNDVNQLTLIKELIDNDNNENSLSPIKAQNSMRFKQSEKKIDNKYFVEVPIIQKNCMIIKKEVLDKVRFDNEQPFSNYFGDMDFCFRVTENGFKCAVAKNVYFERFSSKLTTESKNHQSLIPLLKQFINHYSKERVIDSLDEILSNPSIINNDN
jgi:glycosyltransferase involved in cell wall biosynthesis/GT2 family glycosyltransferase